MNKAEKAHMTRGETRKSGGVEGGIFKKRAKRKEKDKKKKK